MRALFRHFDPDGRMNPGQAGGAVSGPSALAQRLARFAAGAGCARMGRAGDRRRHHRRRHPAGSGAARPAALLVEQRDFAWGTSSRSSKLVHGGLRYLKEGHVRAHARIGARTRMRCCAKRAGLVEPQGFAFADYDGRRPGRKPSCWRPGDLRPDGGRRERHWLDADEF
jgi:hypothetical protein